MVNDLIAISLLQFDTGNLASFVIVQVTIHLCIAIQKMMHLLHISHRVEDNMILTTTNTENYGREEIHKTLVQMADVAVPANESDVLWRNATFEEAVSYLVAIAVVLETDSKKLFAIVSVFHLTTETACYISRYATLTQVLPESRMAQRLFHNITKGITFRLHSLFRYPLIMRKRCREAATKRFRYELGLCHKLIAVDELPCEVFDFIDVHRLDCNQQLLLNVVEAID